MNQDEMVKRLVEVCKDDAKFLELVRVIINEDEEGLTRIFGDTVFKD